MSHRAPAASALPNVRLALALSLLVLLVTGVAPARAAELLPDLDQAPVGCPGGWAGDPGACTAWDVCLVADPSDPNAPCVTSGATSVRLRFTSSEDNVGDGPLLLYGRRDDGAEMDIRQAIETDGYIPESYPAAQLVAPGKLNYEPAASHRHWHVQNFERYELRTIGSGESVLVHDRKNGFCLGDRYPSKGHERLEHDVEWNDYTAANRLHQELEANNCEQRNPGAQSLRMGVSVGRGDDYAYNIDFQWLDITSVPSGVYNVVNRANPELEIREKDYGNNAASMAISVQWPNGAHDPPAVVTAPPVVRMLKNCPDSERCAAPPRNTSKPVVTGTLAVGRSLVCTLGSWQGEPDRFEHQWSRDGAPIAAATGSSYTVAGADVGHTLTVKVTAFNLFASAEATSSPVAVPEPPPSPPVPAPVPPAPSPAPAPAPPVLAPVPFVPPAGPRPPVAAARPPLARVVPSPPTAPPTGGTPKAVMGRISSFALSSRRFHAVRRGSRAATFRVSTTTGGRLRIFAKRRIVRAGRVGYPTVGSLARVVRGKVHRVGWSGRLHGRALRPGRYAARAVFVGADGRKTTSRAIFFTILV